jgi:hypothetical protein
VIGRPEAPRSLFHWFLSRGPCCSSSYVTTCGKKLCTWSSRSAHPWYKDSHRCWSSSSIYTVQCASFQNCSLRMICSGRRLLSDASATSETYSVVIDILLLPEVRRRDVDAGVDCGDYQNGRTFSSWKSRRTAGPLVHMNNGIS